MSAHDDAAVSEIRIGVSACLLGQQVRFDGGHKHDSLLTSLLGPHVTFVPICPEVEMGLGTPRESMRLVRAGRGATVRLIGTRSGTDHTDTAATYSERRAGTIAALNLVGYVLKKDSPSCGMERVKVYDQNGSPDRKGVGFFARALLERHPLLPVEEEGRLHDPALRENFIVRIFAFRRVRDLFAPRWTIAQLVAFHSREKFLLLAHKPSAYTAAGRVVAHAKGRSREEVATEYAEIVMTALSRPATRMRHVNVLQHLAGFFKNQLDPLAKRDVLGVIDDYKRGLVPLVVPVTLVRHYVRLFGVGYLADQVYLQPDPTELLLRAHA